MKKHAFILLLATLFASMGIFAQSNSRVDSLRQAIRNRNKARLEKTYGSDTVKARYPISDISPTTVDDMEHHSLDLRTPQNIVTDTIYNDKDSTYSLVTRLGKRSMLGAPILLTPEEFSKWEHRGSMQR